MKIGLFGLGSIGMRHLTNLVESGIHDNLIVYDPDRTRYKQIEHLPFVIVALHAHEVWQWYPDVVLICTPPKTHYDLASTALKQHCHVFCEKPLADDPRMATALFGAATHLKLVLAVGYQLRWQVDNFRGPASGEKDVFYCCIQDMAKWPSQYQKDALEEFSHELDLAQYVKGPVEAVMAKEYESVWNINLRHLRGYSYVRISSTAPVPPLRNAVTSDPSVKWTFNQEKNDLAYKQELEAFLAVCSGKDIFNDRLCSGAEAAHVCKIIEACRESAKNCSVVRL